MTAAALLQRLLADGFGIGVDDDRLIVKPASKLTETDRVAIRAHKVELLGLVQADQEALEERAVVLDLDVGLNREYAETEARTCAACEHLTRVRTCGEPVRAGLVAYFGIVWPESGYANDCPAFSAL